MSFNYKTFTNLRLMKSFSLLLLIFSLNSYGVAESLDSNLYQNEYSESTSAAIKAGVVFEYWAFDQFEPSSLKSPISSERSPCYLFLLRSNKLITCIHHREQLAILSACLMRTYLILDLQSNANLTKLSPLQLFLNKIPSCDSEDHSYS